MFPHLDPPKILAPPPRVIPITTQLHVLFAGFSSKIGWPIFGLGMIFFWTFIPRSEIMEVGKFRGELKRAKARVNKVRPTGAVINGKMTEEYEYAFWTREGLFRGDSFGYGGQYRTGQEAPVEYVADNPNINRIVGLKTAEYGLAIGFLPLIIPAFGVFMIVIGLSAGSKTLKLLKYGLAAYGKKVVKEATKRQVNDQIVYKLCFEFRAHNHKKYITTTYTHEIHVLEDEEMEIVLYDPSNPRFSMMLDSMSGNPEVSQHGQITSKGKASSIVHLLIPTLSVLGNLAYALIVFQQS